MTPLGFDCPHVCCVDEGPHAHLMDPDACGDCKALGPSDRAKALTERALGIAASKHNPDRSEQ